MSVIAVLAAAVLACGCKGKDRQEVPPAQPSPPVARGPSAMPAAPPAARPDPAAHAAELARRFIIVDGHIDLPYALEADEKRTGSLDLAQVVAGREDGDFDHPRAVRGGLDAPFMSIYIPARYQTQGGARALADRLIDMVEGLARAAPDRFALAPSPAAVKKNFADGKISLPLGIENGAALEGDLANLQHFYDRGVRYITLTHSKDNDICDSSYAKTRASRGLSPFGKRVVAEMNRLGIMIDISHVSDDAFYQVIELTRTPVIASHSSVRHFVPGFERNMSDDMIRKLGDNGGIIMINFGSGFVKKSSSEYSDKLWAATRKFGEDSGLERDHPRVREFVEQYRAKQPFPYADVVDVADHIDHVVKLVGVDHVGFGSDFDGVGDTLPTGLKDVSMYPGLIAELLRRGYSDADIEKICSGNILRVWQAVADHAAKQG